MAKPTTALHRLSTLCATVTCLLFMTGCAHPQEAEDDQVLTFSQHTSLPNFGSRTDDAVLLSWVQKNPDNSAELRYASLTVSSDSLVIGKESVAAEGPDWMLNWADYPSIVRRTSGMLAAHFLTKGTGNKYAYDIQLASQTAQSPGQRSATSLASQSVVAAGDAADLNWSSAGSPHSDGTATEHGFVSLIAEPDDQLGVVWLDGRGYALHDASGASDNVNGESGGPAMSLRYASFSPGGQSQSELVLDSRTCDCCQTDATTLEGGDVLLVYRDRSPEDIRDIAFVRRTEEGWTAPSMVANDGWQIDGCPVQGPSIDAFGQDAAVAWFTAAIPTSVRVSFLKDDGSFGQPTIIDSTGALGRVSLVMLDRHRAAVAWLASGEVGTTEAYIMVAEVDREGNVLNKTKAAVTSSVRASGFPQLSYASGHLILAWTDVTDTPQVKTRLVSLDNASQGRNGNDLTEF